MASFIDVLDATSSPPCWWTKTRDLSLAIVYLTIVIGVSLDWLKTTYRLPKIERGDDQNCLDEAIVALTAHFFGSRISLRKSIGNLNLAKVKFYY